MHIDNTTQRYITRFFRQYAHAVDKTSQCTCTRGDQFYSQTCKLHLL